MKKIILTLSILVCCFIAFSIKQNVELKKYKEVISSYEEELKTIKANELRSLRVFSLDLYPQSDNTTSVFKTAFEEAKKRNLLGDDNYELRIDVRSETTNFLWIEKYDESKSMTVSSDLYYGVAIDNNTKEIRSLILE